jgi:HK97 family phage major capsid protein
MMKALSNPNGKFELNVDKTTVSMSSITSDPGGFMLPGFAPIQTQNNFIASSLNTFTLGADSHGIVRYTDWTSPTSSGAAARADGYAAGESVAAWTGYSAALENISDSIPVHLEALRDVALMESELNNFLTNNLQVKEDSLLYSGDGNTPNIKGLYTYATAFDAAAFISAGGFAPASAGLYDLVVSMAAQIMKASKYMVNVVYINPYDALRMKLVKDTNGQYLFPMYIQTAGGLTMIDNIRVIQSNSVTVNTLVLGDSRMFRRYVGENINLSMGYNASGDFTKRIITILANMAELFLIRTAEQDSLLKSTDITADIAAITGATA